MVSPLVLVEESPSVAVWTPEAPFVPVVEVLVVEAGASPTACAGSPEDTVVPSEGTVVPSED